MNRVTSNYPRVQKFGVDELIEATNTGHLINEPVGYLKQEATDPLAFSLLSIIAGLQRFNHFSPSLDTRNCSYKLSPMKFPRVRSINYDILPHGAFWQFGYYLLRVHT